jgi:hypothetical protein
MKKEKPQKVTDFSLIRTKKDLIELFQALETAVKKGTTMFKLLIFRNLKLIESEIESLKTIEKEINQVLEPYHTEYSGIIQQYGTERNGQLTIEKSDKNYTQALKEIKLLEIKFKEDISLHNAKMKDYTETLLTPIDFSFDPVEINEKILPADLSYDELKQFINFGILKLQAQ